jgi:hypothetical protein
MTQKAAYFREKARDVREDLAEQTFGQGAALAMVVERSGMGHKSGLLRPPHPVELADTAAAAAAVQLLKGAGFSVAWVPSVVKAKSARNDEGEDVAVNCLLVSWDGPAGGADKAARQALKEPAPAHDNAADGQGEGVAADFVPGM